ncbi:DUF6286 domain-containing protein [Actinotalea sp. Marseille-Q4924]|uniref:DUF6286 domain-containing protein n=1 Tax=Actinotalea sp. Marseille-Q4924 TaxID=2866571 RepID=UPI001CE43E8D|nr:DUF6286 domain-containing protein [Actinotalea sp. Marseille-Q4924]
MTPTSPPVPRKAAGAGIIGMLLAVLLVALGILLVHEGLALQGWIDGSPLLEGVLSRRAVVEPGLLTTVVAAALALLGLWLLVTAFRRGRRRGVELDARTRVWMSHRDLDRLVTGTAEEVDGVLGARASVGRRRAVVHVDTTTPEVRGEVAAAVERRLTALDGRPRVDVRATPRHERETR